MCERRLEEVGGWSCAQNVARGRLIGTVARVFRDSQGVKRE